MEKLSKDKIEKELVGQIISNSVGGIASWASCILRFLIVVVLPIACIAINVAIFAAVFYGREYIIFVWIFGCILLLMVFANMCLAAISTNQS